MKISADITIPAEVKGVNFGRTIINWDRQEIMFQYNNGESHIHKMSQGDWNYLTSGLKTKMEHIAGIANLDIPDYNPNFWDEE